MESVVNDNVMNDDNIINSDGESYGDTMTKKKRKSSNSSISNAKGERKKMSYVWDHFKEISDSNNEAKSEKDVVECNYCGKCIAYKPSYGTSGMKNHIARCKRFPANLNRKQKLVDFESETITSPGGTSKIVQVPTCWQFDQDNCRKALARMLIVDELPFVFVEHEGFRYFCKQLCPKFVPPSRKTVTRDCYSIFIEERSKLKDIFSKLSSRVCLTTDTWTSGQNLGGHCRKTPKLSGFRGVHRLHRSQVNEAEAEFPRICQNRSDCFRTKAYIALENNSLRRLPLQNQKERKKSHTLPSEEYPKIER
ncbi:hypothetical protein V6N13_148112 [Hibiscus sabdariffa]